MINIIGFVLGENVGWGNCKIVGGENKREKSSGKLCIFYSCFFFLFRKRSKFGFSGGYYGN
jgi:hypothetical protein